MTVILRRCLMDENHLVGHLGEMQVSGTVPSLPPPSQDSDPGGWDGALVSVVLTNSVWRLYNFFCLHWDIFESERRHY